MTTDHPRRFPPAVTAALVAVPAVFVGLLFAWPTATILARGLSVEALRDMATNPGVRSVAWFTLWQAAVSTICTLTLGLAPAWVIARYRFPGRTAFTALVTVPFVLPTVVVGAAFLAVAPARFEGSVLAILAAHVFFNVAVVVRTVGTLWEQLDPDLVAAARTLGASPWQAFCQVTAPLLRPAVLAAASIVFLFTFTSYGVIRILGGPGRATIEVEIYLRAAQLGDLAGASALALVQLVAVGTLLWLWGRSQARAAVPLRLRAARDRRRPRTRRERLLVSGVVVTTTMAFLAPLAALALRSVRVGDRWTLAGWRALTGDAARPGVASAPDALGAVATSLRVAALATLVAVTVGVLASVAIAGTRRAGRLLDAGLMLPLGTSAVTIGFGILITFDEPPLDLRDAPLLVPFVHALVAVPFVVRAVLPVLRAIPDDLRAAAGTLGAGPWRVWRTVDLPLAARGILTGAAFAAAISLGEFGATSFLTRRDTETLPIAIERLLGRTGDVLQAQAYALAVILLALTVAIVGLLSLVAREPRHRPQGAR